MKTVKFFFFAIVFSLSISCGNKDLESRVTKLEGRIAALEGKGRVQTVQSSPTTPSDPPPSSTTTPPPAEKPDGPLPLFQFEKEHHDFGAIKEGDVVEHVFNFTNDGDAPLIISNAQASCGCTIPEWPKEPIAIGKIGQIKVRFDSKGKPGNQNKTITLTANTWPNTKRISIRAQVEKGK